MTAVVEMAHVHPEALDEHVRRVPALLLPVGTLEFHGDHLPLGVDGLKAEAVAREAARVGSGVLAPTSWWAADGVPGPYTLRLPTQAAQDLMSCALCELAKMGFSVIAIVNGHYGLQNSLATRRAALVSMSETRATVLPIADYEVLLDLGASGDHAGVFETSFTSAVRPDLVRLDTSPAEEPLRGVLGADPRGVASAELGRRAIAHAGAAIAAAVSRALTFPPAERNVYVEALEAGTAALEAVDQLRRSAGRTSAPPVQTPAWLAHLRALHAGDHQRAAAYAERKRADPWA